jgi:hypothetical protein
MSMLDIGLGLARWRRSFVTAQTSAIVGKARTFSAFSQKGWIETFHVGLLDRLARFDHGEG